MSGAILHDGLTAAPARVALKPDRIGERLVILDDAGRELAVWPFAEIRELRDHGRVGTLVAHIPGHEARLVIDDPEAAGNFRAMLPGIGRFHSDRSQVRRALWWAGGAIASILALVFIIIPGLADQLARALPPERETAFGRTVIRQITWVLGTDEAQAFCQTEAGGKALDALAARLAAGASLPYPLSVQVVNNPMVNAFAVPGGQIVIMRGLIDEADSGDEVAAVLAHEIGHVVARDPTRIALRAAGSAGLLGLFFGDVAGGTAAAAVTEQLARASYARQAEAAADGFAHKAMTSAGMSPAALASFFQRLKSEYGDTDGAVAAFLSHPRFADRIAAAQSAAAPDQATAAFTQGEWQAVRSMCSAKGLPDA